MDRKGGEKKVGEVAGAQGCASARSPTEKAHLLLNHQSRRKTKTIVPTAALPTHTASTMVTPLLSDMTTQRTRECAR